MIPTQRGAKRVNEERVFIAAEVGFSGALTFVVDGSTVEKYTKSFLQKFTHFE